MKGSFIDKQNARLIVRNIAKVPHNLLWGTLAIYRLEKNIKSSPIVRRGSGEGAPSGCPLALNSRPEGVKISFS